MKPLPDRTQVVIIGGGIHGCSVAYHLAKAGWKDVVLLERKQLTSGTTWHAAGLVGQLQGSHSTTAFAKYGVELLQDIEAETGQNPGYRRSGSISIAVNTERHADYVLNRAHGEVVEHRAGDTDVIGVVRLLRMLRQVRGPRASHGFRTALNSAELLPARKHGRIVA